MHHLPSQWMCSPTWKLLNPYFWDFMEASSRGHDQLLTPFPALLPSLETEVKVGERAKNSKLLILAWSF